MIQGFDTAGVAGNKNVDWAKVAKDNKFGIVRTTYGTFKDTQFDKFWPEIKKAGMVRGAYLFWRINQDSEAQVKAFTDTVDHLGPGDLPPIFDVEFSKGLKATGFTPAQAIQKIKECVLSLKAFYKTYPIIYTSARVWRDDLQNLSDSELLNCPLHLARYFPDGILADPPVPKPWGDSGNWDIHQHAGNVKDVPGFDGAVDLNRFNTLKKGTIGARVKSLQKRLKVKVDGSFGKDTENALKAFQTSKKLQADGIMGLNTFSYLAWETT